jgi:hypothetical protein
MVCKFNPRGSEKREGERVKRFISFNTCFVAFLNVKILLFSRTVNLCIRSNFFSEKEIFF